MGILDKKAKEENVYLSNGITAYRTEPTGEESGKGFSAFVKIKDGEVPVAINIDRLNKMLIEEEGWEIDREQYYLHINCQEIF